MLEISSSEDKENKVNVNERQREGIRGEPRTKKFEGLLASSMGKTCLWLDPLSCMETTAYDSAWDVNDTTEAENANPESVQTCEAKSPPPTFIEIKLPTKCTHLRWNSSLQTGLATFRQTPNHPKTSHFVFKLNFSESSEMTPVLQTIIKGNSISKVLSRSLLCSLSGRLLAFTHNEELSRAEVWDGTSGELIQGLAEGNPNLVSGENPWDVVHYKVGTRDYIGLLKPGSLLIYSVSCPRLPKL